MLKAMLLLTLVASALAAQDLPAPLADLRADHPRLFFNADTWPAVQERALGAEREWFERIKTRLDDVIAKQPEGELPTQEWGVFAAWSAFVYRVTGEPQYLDFARRALPASVAFYEQRLAERKTVNWYSTSRNHWLMAWDWLYDELPDAERRAWLERFIDTVEGVLTANPRIQDENISGPETGYYGVGNIAWFAALAAAGEGVREEWVDRWLARGYAEHMKLLEHRRRAAGDDGGGASPTVGYTFAAYPWSEYNFLYNLASATGHDISADWPHSAWLANYVMWNWIPGPERPLEFGYGDTPHTTNYLPTGQLYTHMGHVRHFYGRSLPEAAGLAHWLQNEVPEWERRWTDTWFIYPFLMADLESSPPALEPGRLPPARNFEQMGQVFMRSGSSPDDTYALFTVGGVLRQHRHYDALNFVLYKHGHQALDTGTRWMEDELLNGRHLANYYAQSAAHNVVLIHGAEEPPAPYWGMPPGERMTAPNYGGQRDQLGSVLKAFETNPRFTYVAGDATAAYAQEKAALVTRQFVFLMPNHFVVFDRVRSTQPEYRKEWLIHPASEPQFDGATFRSEHLGGAMLCRTLLPENPQFNVVGGPGREFDTGGVNWPIFTGKPDGTGPQLKPEHLQMMGQWRVEVTAPEAEAETLFLHVVEVGGQDLTAMGETELLREPGRVGVRLTAAGRNATVWFASEGDVAGHITLGEEIDRPLTQAVQPQEGILAE